MRYTLATIAALIAALGLAPVAADAAATHNGRIAYSLGAILPDPDPEAPSQVYTVNPDGTGVRQLTHVTLPVQAGDPNYSPDGKRLLYVSNAGGGPFQVWIMNADGSHQRKLLTDPGFDAFLPRWSPNGSHFLFTRCEFVLGFLECTIATAAKDGSGLRLATRGHDVDDVGSYGPRGSYIAFSSNRKNSVSALWRTTNGHGPRRLTPPQPEAFWPDVSPDGSRILYTDNRDRPDSSQHTIRPDGTGDRTLAPGCFGSWSPDAAYIAYDGGLDCDQGLTVARSDGSHRRVVVATTDLVLADWGPQS